MYTVTKVNFYYYYNINKYYNNYLFMVSYRAAYLNMMF